MSIVIYRQHKATVCFIPYSNRRGESIKASNKHPPQGRGKHFLLKQRLNVYQISEQRMKGIHGTKRILQVYGNTF